MSANIPNDPVAIQRFFTSRDNNADAATYVGQEQRLWYDPTTNAIYVSDGNTAGGVMVGAGGSGNGVPGGPTNSIQYNAGSGNFGGTANLIISGNGVSVVGNVTSAYFIGNGSQLTDLPVQTGTYSNSNVATFLNDFGSNAISTSGNITGNFFIGDGSQLTNLPVGNYSNTNVAAYLTTANISTTGNIDANNIATGLITITDLYSPNFYSNAVIYSNSAGYISSTNLFKYNPGTGTLTVDAASLTGNITANYFIGDGSQLTNLPVQPGTYGNSNVVTLLADFGSNNISTTGAVFGGNINANNVNSNNVLTDNYLYANGDSIFNNIVLTGNIDLGNLVINDQTISGTITDRDIVLNPAGNGVVNVNGAFHIHTGNLTADPIFQVTIDGRVKTLVPNTSSYNGAFNIVGSADGAEVPPQNYGVMLHMTGQSTIPARFYSDGVANYAAYVGRRYNGISSAPTPVLINQIINRVAATPYVGDTATGWPNISTARIDFITTENQSAANNGSKIQMWATPTGTDVANIALIADFSYGGINLTGNLIPTADNVYSLGNVTNRWIGAYFGNAGIYIQDTTLGTTGQISLDNGVMLFNSNISALQVGNIQVTNTGLLSTVSTQDIVIGTLGDTGNTVINNAGIKFTDGSIQTTAAIPLTQKGNALGVVPLNSSVKIDPIYLPAGGISFQGVWNASNNTPTLADGVGTAGYEYIVGVAGTQNLGSGNITFAVGDFVLYTTDSVWVDIPVGTPGVTAFNNRTGNVTLESGDVTNALSTGSIVNSKLLNSNVTVTTGTGLNGGQVVPLGGNITLTANVANIVAGTGVTVTPAAGTYTIAIGQPVGTANTVQFNAISSTTTIQATSNITGGNLITGGQVVATGNILTSGFISATGNIRGGNLSVVGNTTTANLSVTGITNLNSNANVKISGGTTGQQLTTDGSGNLYWSLAQAGNTIIQSAANTTINIDFTTNSLHLLYLPTANVTVNLSNYTTGAQARVIVRYGATPYTIALGVGNVQQTTEGSTTIPISGAGGHKIQGNQSVQLLYTCFDNTAGNCYVASTFL